MIGMPLHTMAQSLAYVDARRLIDEAPQGKDEFKSLEAKFSERNGELKRQFEEYKAQEADLQKNELTLSSEEVEEKTRLLRDQQIQLNRGQQIFNEDYTRARNEGLARLEKLISEVIIEFAAEEKIDLVVQQAVFASDDINVTNRVLDRLQKMYGQ